jgi:stalled ribosome rescue protein Dom34
MPTMLLGSLPVNLSSEKGTKEIKKEVGLWIDHRDAFLVTITEKGEETTRLYSNIEVDAQFSGRSRSGGSQDAENMQDRQYTNKLEKYYDAIVGNIRNADSIWIFGPGEAKGELVKRLESKNLSQRIVGIETTDKLTEPQIAAKVRQYFPR